MAELDPRAAGGKRLEDKVCVVTVAGQGIGRAAARRLGQEGGKIVVASLSAAPRKCCAQRVAPPVCRGQLRYAVPSLVGGKESRVCNTTYC